MLENVTPLKRDCGKICHEACCSDTLGDDSGMLLFPGEEEIMADNPCFRIEEGSYSINGTPARICVCEGMCRRKDRPLSCRIFPLTFHVENGSVTAVMNAEALSLCPLAAMNMDSLSREFVTAVENAGQLLYGNEIYRPFITYLSERNDEMLMLQQKFRK